MDQVVNLDHLPIERHWYISMVLHRELKHTETWEICQEGCDELATKVILAVFGENPSFNVDSLSSTNGGTMGLIRNPSKDITTVGADLGLDAIVAVWVHLPIDEVEKILTSGGFVKGDSPMGEIRVNSGSAKYLQPGEREINSPAANRDDA